MPARSSRNCRPRVTVAPAAALTATAATSAACCVERQFALEIAAFAKNGKSSFEIRLNPAELGRIDVRIDVDRNGQMTSHLTVEKPENAVDAAHAPTGGVG